MIHKFKIGDKNIVLDVNSGAVHIFDGLAWDLLDDAQALSREDVVAKYKSRFGTDEILEVLDEINALTDRGMLFSEDRYTAGAGVNSNFPPVVKSICLNVSHDCNLGCRYCFAGKGHFGGPRALMSYEVGCRAIDFLLESSGGRRHCELDFFGGEPLMNIEAVEKLVSYGKSKAEQKNKEIKFTLTTNALLLNDKISGFLNREAISVVLSLDGRPAVNDTMRPMAGGKKGSYEYIRPKITSFIKSRNNENYIVRGTYTRQNLDFSKDVLHLADLGYKYISVEPVVGAPSEEWSLQEQDLARLCQEYDDLVQEYVNRLKAGRPFDFFHFNLDLDNGPCLPKRLSGCGAGHEYMAVTPEGDLFPCHQFVGRDAFKMGTVFEGVSNLAMVNEFRDAHIYNKAKCRSCWAKFHCGGGCHANAEFTNGSVAEPYSVGCELEKKRLECAIYAQVIKAAYNEI